MRIPQSVLIFAIALSAAIHAQGAAVPAQQPATVPGAEAQTQGAAPATAAVTASSLLKPALAQAQSTLTLLKIDKWKKGSVRDEAGENVNALLRDLQSNIPPLIEAADAEPSALSRAIPLTKHLDAFYAVLLRVEEAARVVAPSEQITALQQILLDVNKARIAYDDQLQAQAAAQEKQVFDLRTELQAQKEAAARETKTTAAAAVPCKPAAPARRKKKTTTSSSKATPSKPSASTPSAPTTTKPQ